jgi:HSP20 family protein
MEVNCLSEDWWPFSGRWMFEDIDEIIREMEKTMQRQFEDLSKTAPKSLIRERVLHDGTTVKEWGPFVYGYSMTMGPDGRLRIREFGNIKPKTHMGRPQINVREQREPLVDVLETDCNIRIVAEMPGVEKEDIRLHGTKTVLTISVDTPQRKYYKEINLPDKVNPKQAKSTYNNGVLEITLPKQEDVKRKGESITIE